LKDLVGAFLEGFTAPTDGYPDLASGEQIVIVFGVTNPNGVMN